MNHLHFECRYRISLSVAGRGKISVLPGNNHQFFLSGLKISFMLVHSWLQIQTDSEELLIIKTRESLLEALTEHVKANHEYE